MTSVCHEAFCFIGVKEMTPTKMFNLILPFSTYRELKHISMREGKPISEIVRKGIDIVLGKPKCEDVKNAGN